MADWLKIAARSFAVAALAGAAQLGAAQALALLVWSSVPEEGVWRRQLTWVLFIFAAAVLAGVAGGRRSVRVVRQTIANRRAEAAAARAAQPGTKGSARYKTVDAARGFAAAASRVGATLFASLGAFASYLLVWLPARNTFSGADLGTLALAAAIGTAVGACLSLLALAAAPVAANAAIWIGGVWIFGLASVFVAIATGQPTTAPRLGVLDAPRLIGPDEWWLGPNVMVLVAAVFAVAVAATARWVGASRLTIAVSGLAGPAIVSAAYIIVGPGDELRSGYVAAMVAAAVGLLTSVVTSVARRPRRAPKPDPDATPVDAAALATKASTTKATKATKATKTSKPMTARTTTPTPPATAPSPQYAMAGATTAPASSYPAPNPPSQYPGAAQYSANPYPTNQYPTRPDWSASTVDTSASVTTSPRRPAATTPPPAAPPTPPPPPAPTPPRAPAAAVPAPTAPPAPAPAPKQAKARGRAEKTARVPEKKAAPGKSTPPQPVRPAVAAPAPTAAPAPAAPAAAKPAATKKTRAKPARAKPAPAPAKPSTTAAPAQSAPAADTGMPKGRRARRRAAKIAAMVAEEQARRAKQLELDEKTMGKREREHVDWVKHLTSIPADPTLTTRQK